MQREIERLSGLERDIRQRREALAAARELLLDRLTPVPAAPPGAEPPPPPGRRRARSRRAELVPYSD
jgi:hypothetical protein